MTSKSCTPQSRNIPPETATYSGVGGSGSSVVDSAIPQTRSSERRQGLGGEVVRRDDLDAGVPGARGVGQRAVRLHHHVAGAAQVEGEVVVQHRRQLPVLQQREVLVVEVVG